jgi:hypothetical protein
VIGSMPGKVKKEPTSDLGEDASIENSKQTKKSRENTKISSTASKNNDDDDDGDDDGDSETTSVSGDDIDEMELEGGAQEDDTLPSLGSPPLTGDNNMYEAGMILEVYMENFMNHRKFSLVLGKLVNFVTGQNGSGKSACVAAIQLCLGATASKTGRASNMAKMVRHGSPGPAICRVKLLNEGMAWCGVMWYGMIWCAMMCGMLCCCVVWYDMVFCDVLCCVVLWYGVLCCGVVWAYLLIYNSNQLIAPENNVNPHL